MAAGNDVLAGRIKPCPFAYCSCPGRLIEDVVDDLEGREKRFWRVIGSRCKSLGPSGGGGDLGKMTAIERWNSRGRE